jgi:MoaA/NifB/PqqE/SkfB family radical SAM enzyme
LTNKCNKNCEYCFRFDKEEDLPIDVNLKILYKLKEIGIKKINWSGGEPTLYNNLLVLLKESKKIGLINGLITNGSKLIFKEHEEIFKYIDEITLSVDYIDDNQNARIGRGIDYYKTISSLLKLLNNYYPNIIIKINTIILPDNINNLKDIYNDIANYKINKWKLIHFCPFRGRARENKESFSIDNQDFEKIKLFYGNIVAPFNIDFHNINDMEEKHVLITPDGSITICKNGSDHILLKDIYSMNNDFIIKKLRGLKR